MNLRNSLLFLTSILLLPSTTSASTLNPFKVQQISNFPAECAAAYNVDISDCTSSEISVTGNIEKGGQGICSLQCIAALSVVNSNLNIACEGVQANPNTLIGLFFNGKAISYLCPNSVEGNGPAPSSTGDSSISTSSLPSSSTESSTSTSTSTSTRPSSITTQISQSTSSTTTEKPSPSPSPSFQPTTAVNNGIATVFTSEAQRTSSSNPDAFGGGGSPFEVAANAAPSGKVRNSVPAVLSAALFWAVVAGCRILVGG
jgi:hypothetical protein